MDILDDMGVSKSSAIFFFFKVNYSFKRHPLVIKLTKWLLNTTGP